MGSYVLRTNIVVSGPVCYLHTKKLSLLLFGQRERNNEENIIFDLMDKFQCFTVENIIE